MKCLWVLACYSFKLFACTDFAVRASDGTCVNGRSMEFAMDLRSKVQVFARKMQGISKGPDGEKGLSWVSQYGFLGVTAFGLNFTIDGMNEKGLSLGMLWFPGTQYQTIKQDSSQTPLDLADLGNWILGNFANVLDVKEALKGICVWGHPVPPLTSTPPLHLALHDADGRHLVVEFIKGEMKIYENQNTVLTNYPPFDWMLINLQNYINLTALNAPNVKFNENVIGGTGQGSGMLGIPGDWTPPSRFVRMTTFLRFVKQTQKAEDTVNLAEHLLNIVDIPIGVVRDRLKSEYTQWIVIKDQTSKVFYFRSYKDMCLKSIDMKRVNFNPGAKGAVDIEMSHGYMDVTSSLKSGVSFSPITDAQNTSGECPRPAKNP